MPACACRHAGSSSTSPCGVPSVGFVTCTDWDREAQEKVVQLAMRQRMCGRLNYTDAYDPSRSNRQQELRSSGSDVQDLYRRTCASLLGLWHACDWIGQVAVNSKSWEKSTKCIMKVRGYGGTGFLAKELSQDLTGAQVGYWDPEQFEKLLETGDNVCIGLQRTT